jgi:hypothetical protein
VVVVARWMGPGVGYLPPYELKKWGGYPNIFRPICLAFPPEPSRMGVPPLTFLALL